MQDHEFSCNLSSTLWQTWCLYHFLFLSNERDDINVVNQHVVLWNVKVIKVPEDYIITGSWRVNKALREEKEDAVTVTL